MRQVWIRRHGGPEVLELREAPDPEPAAGEARVRVRTIGVNFADIMARKGLYPDAPKPPCVVGYEIAGVVDTVGSGEIPFHPGDRVFGLTPFGGYSDTVVLPADHLFALPEGLSFEQAVALPVTYLTAYAALLEMARVREGDVVLIHNIGGGVGLAALDLCRMRKTVIIGTASGWKHDRLREWGAKALIDYRRQDVEHEVMQYTGGRGVDIVLDPIGGANWSKDLRLLRPMGRLICYGASSLSTGPRRSLFTMATWALRVPWLSFMPISLMNHNRGVMGLNLGHMWEDKARLKGWMEDILRWVEAGHVRPHVDRTFPLSDVADAHRYIEARRNLGKVVLIASPRDDRR